MPEGFLPPVVVHLLADIKEFQAKMGEANAEMDKLSAKGASTGTLLAKGFTTAALGVGGLAVGVIGISALLGEKFQSALAKTSGQLGLNQTQTQKLSDEFSKMGKSSEFSSTEIANAYAGVARQVQELVGGQDLAKSSTDVLNAAMELAVATGGDLTSTTSTLVGIMRTFQQPTSSAGDMMATLYNTSTLTGNSLTQLVPALSKMGKSFAGVSPDVSDLASLMVDLSQHGINGSRAMMGVTTAFQKMLDPSFQAKAAQAGLNLQVYDGTGKFVGFRNVIAQLTPQIAGLSQEQVQAKLSSAGFGSAAQALTPALLAGVSAYDKASTAVKDHHRAHTAAEKAGETFHGRLKKLQSAATTFATDLGNMLLPKLTDFVNWLDTKGIKAIEDFRKGFDGKHVRNFAGAVGEATKTISHDIGALFTGIRAVWDKMPGPLKVILAGGITGAAIGGKYGGPTGAGIGFVAGASGAQAIGGAAQSSMLNAGAQYGNIGATAFGFKRLFRDLSSGNFGDIFGAAGSSLFGTPAGAAERPRGAGGAGGNAAISFLTAINSNTLSTTNELTSIDGRLGRHGGMLQTVATYAPFVSQHTREANSHLVAIARNTGKTDKVNIKVRLV